MRLRTPTPLTMTTTTLTPIKEQTTFWALPEQAQEEIVDLLPKQDTWVLNVVRNDNGTWYFDLNQYGIYNELLVGGTELALDWHYLDLTEKQYDQYALEGAELELVVSSKPIEGCTTTLHLMCFDAEESKAAFYKDSKSSISCWLCPMLYYMFKEVPGTLYLDLYPDTWED